MAPSLHISHAGAAPLLCPSPAARLQNPEPPFLSMCSCSQDGPLPVVLGDREGRGPRGRQTGPAGLNKQEGKWDVLGLWKACGRRRLRAGQACAAVPPRPSDSPLTLPLLPQAHRHRGPSLLPAPALNSWLYSIDISGSWYSARSVLAGGGRRSPPLKDEVPAPWVCGQGVSLELQSVHLEGGRENRAQGGVPWWESECFDRVSVGEGVSVSVNVGRLRALGCA